MARIRLPPGLRQSAGAGLRSVAHRLARRSQAAPTEEPSGPRTAFVLSGGARLGALQATILRALYDRGVRPDLLVGTSAGAFNAAYLAFHPDDGAPEELVEIWRGLRFERIFAQSALRVALAFTRRRESVLGVDQLRHLVDTHIHPDAIEAAAVPLRLVASDITAGEKRVFREGSARRAVLASSAIPGVFPPVEIDGHLHVDGGLLANLDLETAVAEGAREIYAIDVSQPPDTGRPRRFLDVIGRSVEVMLNHRSELALRHVRRVATVHLLHPEPGDWRELAGASDARSLVERATPVAERIVERTFAPSAEAAPREPAARRRVPKGSAAAPVPIRHDSLP